MRQFNFGAEVLYLGEKKTFAGNAFFNYREHKTQEFESLCNYISEILEVDCYDQEGRGKRIWPRLDENQVRKLEEAARQYNASNNLSEKAYSAKPSITKEQYIKAFEQGNVLRKDGLRLLEAWQSLPNQIATAGVLSEILESNGIAPINSMIGSLGTRVAEYLNIKELNEHGKPLKGWRILASGEEKEFFEWTMHSDLSEAVTVYRESLNQKHELWGAFLVKWPKERLETMSIDEYTGVGDETTFTHWLEFRLRELGSVKGGSSFKFGVFKRKAQDEAEDDTQRCYSNNYGWYRKYGESVEQAFQKVRGLIVEVVDAASESRVEDIDDIDLGESIKWKIAFLYQPKNSYAVINIFKKENLAALTGLKRKVPVSELQKRVLGDIQDRDVFEYSDGKWAESELIIKNASLVQESAVDFKAREIMANDIPLNQIFYGPPGTGKTYHTINAALEILDPDFLLMHRDSVDARALLKERFDQLSKAGDIGFVTFHQSFSYEDFIEGLKATTDNGVIKYDVEDGIFKLLCSEAEPEVEKATYESIEIAGKTIWKMSLGNTLGDRDVSIYDYCIEENEIRLGYGKALDFTDCGNGDAIRAKLESEGFKLSEQAYQVTAVNNFKNKMRQGDLVIITDGNLKFRAIGEIDSDYSYSTNEEVEHYVQMRKVKWHRVYEKSLPYTSLMKKKFSQMTIYKPSLNAIDLDKLQTLLTEEAKSSKQVKLGQQFGRSGYVVVSVSKDLIRLQKPRADSVIALDMQLINALVKAVNHGALSIEDINEKRVFDKTELKLEKYIVNGYSGLIARIVEFLADNISPQKHPVASSKKNRVLIIDEINRGNISSIFGELITLIEPSKRAGRDEALSVLLPYSKEVLKVPDNLYIIGTMNTADRSLALMDTALRRRFDFVEMMPDSTKLENVVVKGVAIDRLIQKMNQRIEVLYDREHTLGHAFFMSLLDTDKTEDQKFDELKLIFKNKILPLLEEYFFEDWEKIRLVLADNQTKARDEQFIIANADIDTNKLFRSNDDGLMVDSVVYERNNDALDNPEAYRKIHG